MRNPKRAEKNQIQRFLGKNVFFCRFVNEGYRERLESIVQRKGGDAREERIIIWTAGLQIFKHNLWTGVCQQNFQYLVRHYCLRLGLEHSFRRADAHNQLILTAAETGIFGLFALLFAIYFHYCDLRYLKRVWKTDENYLNYIPLLTGLQSGMLGFLVGAMFHSYPISENFYWFLVVPGLIRSAYESKRKASYPVVDNN